MSSAVTDAKSAVRAAKDYLNSLLADESLSNVGLEELEYDDAADTWRVTLGFSRPWNAVRNSLTALTGEPAPKRTYRVLEVRPDGRVLSFKRKAADD